MINFHVAFNIPLTVLHFRPGIYTETITDICYVKLRAALKKAKLIGIIKS